MEKTYRALGFMSGTSMDGIDLALIETDGENQLTRLGGMSKPYTDEMRDRISQATQIVQTAKDDEWPYQKNAEMPSRVSTLESLLVEEHTFLAKDFLKSKSLYSGDIDFIGYHGQTLIHRPEIGFTLQLANGAMLAENTGITVVNELRQNDMREGGEGAPLAPIYHKCLVTKFINEGKLDSGPHIFVNIGGVSNVTYIDEEGGVFAFDTGPGNALLDDWVLALSGKKYDESGALSLKGTAEETWCEEVLKHPFFQQSPPKSIDRDLFAGCLASLKEKNISIENGAATLVLLTARAIANSASYFAASPLSWIVGGGGRRNKAILKALQNEVSGEVINSDDLDIDGDLIEAECFAYLAVRSVSKKPITFSGTTGVKAPLTGGVIHTP